MNTLNSSFIEKEIEKVLKDFESITFDKDSFSQKVQKILEHGEKGDLETQTEELIKEFSLQAQIILCVFNLGKNTFPLSLEEQKKLASEGNISTQIFLANYFKQLYKEVQEELINSPYGTVKLIVIKKYWGLLNSTNKNKIIENLGFLSPEENIEDILLGISEIIKLEDEFMQILIIQYLWPAIGENNQELLRNSPHKEVKELIKRKWTKKTT